MVVSRLFVLAFLVIVHAGYVLGARQTIARFGRPALPALLLAFSYGLSALAGWRIHSVTPSTSAYRPYDSNPVWMVSLYAGVLLVALLPTTLRLARPNSAPPAASPRQQVLAEIPWFILGLVIAFPVLTVLDVAGIQFLPPPPRQDAPLGAV